MGANGVNSCAMSGKEAKEGGSRWREGRGVCGCEGGGVGGVCVGVKEGVVGLFVR